MSSGFIRKADEPGYIVAWRDRYEHRAGKLTEQVMSYAEACARADALCAEHPDRTFWAERLEPGAVNRFYNPDAH